MGKFTDEIIFVCDCNSVDHQIIFELWKDPSFMENYMVHATIHLNKRPFFERLRYGLKYIFGYRSNYGAFDEFIFQPEDADKLQKVVDQLKHLQKYE